MNFGLHDLELGFESSLVFEEGVSTHKTPIPKNDYL
jgi:hypothetical protein